VEFRRYWEIILRNRILIISLVVCASLGALAATYIMPETYTASALILIRPLDTRRVTDPPAGMKEKELLGFPLVGADAKVFNQSYAEIIQSRATAKQIVEALHLHEIPERVDLSIFTRAWKYTKEKANFCFYATLSLLKYGRVEVPDPYEGLIDAIKGSISAQEIRDTYLVQINVNSDDPSFGALIANSAAKVFVDQWRKSYHEDTQEDIGILEGQFMANDAELKTLLNDLEDYKKREGVVDLDVQIPSKIASMSTFEFELRKAEADIQELLQERREIQRRLAKQQEMYTASTVVGENPIVIDLRETLVNLEIEMAGLGKRFTETHPEVIALQAKIEETRRALAAEKTRTVSDETSAIDPLYLELQLRLSAVETRLPALERKREAYASTIEEYRSEVEELRNKMKELDILERKAEILKGVDAEFITEIKDYHVLATKRPEEMRIVSEATPPLYPSGPIKILYVGIAAAVSLIIGAGLAFFLEYLNIRIRTIEEAGSTLDLPVLATIPRIRRLAEAELPEILIPEVPASPS
jgi:succinoglycan biosynthesis transport protein ExoP